MKVKEVEVQSKPRNYIPIHLEITLETVEEARLFYHVLRHRNLFSRIIEDVKAEERTYFYCAANLYDLGSFKMLEQIIQRQGFDL